MNDAGAGASPCVRRKRTARHLQFTTVMQTSVSAYERAPRWTMSPSLELVPLEVFVGTWTTHGEQYESPFGPAGELAWRETWEWMPGSVQLRHHVDAVTHGAPVAPVSVFGADVTLGQYHVRCFRDDGTSDPGHLSVENEREWLLTTSLADRGLAWVRCTIVHDRANATRSECWEWSDDAITWQAFRRLTSEKA